MSSVDLPLAGGNSSSLRGLGPAFPNLVSGALTNNYKAGYSRHWHLHFTMSNTLITVNPLPILLTNGPP